MPETYTNIDTAPRWIPRYLLMVQPGQTFTVGRSSTGINGVTVAQFDTNTKFGVGHATAGVGVTYDNLSFT